MSADNGLYVAKISDAEGYGVFHYFASNEEPWGDRDFVLAKARVTALKAGDAIIAAFRHQTEVHTEYGVSVNSEALEVAAQEISAIDTVSLGIEESWGDD